MHRGHQVVLSLHSINKFVWFDALHEGELIFIKLSELKLQFLFSRCSLRCLMELYLTPCTCIFSLADNFSIFVASEEATHCQCDVLNHREALTWTYKVLASNCHFNALGKKWQSKRQSFQRSCMSLQSSHLALIDTLMMAYTVEMVSVERVMSCINRYSSAEPSHSDSLMHELPYDTEDAIITWINKVI